MIPLLLTLLLADSGVPLRDGCSPDDSQIAVVSDADRVEVRQAIAGGDGACYQIQVTRGGSTISGYVLGQSLPAVAQFAAERERVDRESLEAFAREQAAQAARDAQAAKALIKPSAKAKPGTPKAPTPEFLSDFMARDVEGRAHRISNLPGRLIIVAFWSGRARAGLDEVRAAYLQFKGRGVSAVGINMDGVKMLARETEDIDLFFPQWADPGGIAQRFGVDRGGKTFVLDRSLRVLAAGSGADAARAVRNIMKGKPASAE